MTIADAASAAIFYFERHDATTMVAIAGGESGYRTNAQGDALESFSPTLQDRWRIFAVDGFLSFGLWQIFLGVHTELIKRLSGLENQRALAEWLFIPANNARAAREILSSGGFGSWSVYSNGAFQPFLFEAEAAVERAIAEHTPPGSKLVVAVSIAPPHVHIDYEDGTYTETELLDVKAYGPWIRFEVTGFHAAAPPQLPLIV